MKHTVQFVGTTANHVVVCGKSKFLHRKTLIVNRFNGRAIPFLCFFVLERMELFGDDDMVTRVYRFAAKVGAGEIARQAEKNSGSGAYVGPAISERGARRILARRIGKAAAREMYACHVWLAS